MALDQITPPLNSTPLLPQAMLLLLRMLLLNSGLQHLLLMGILWLQIPLPGDETETLGPSSDI